MTDPDGTKEGWGFRILAQYIDDIIVWGNMTGEGCEEGEKIIQIFLKASFSIKQGKFKGPT